MDKAARDTTTDAPRSNQTSGSEQTADAPDFDALARILTDERRRDIIHLLHLHGAQTPDELVHRRAGSDASAGDWQRERTAVHGALHWYLDKHGVVEWDGHADDVITPGQAFEHAREMLHGMYDGYAEAKAARGDESE